MTTETRYYIATDTDRTAIYGIGTSVEEAADDARHESNDPDSRYLILEATERLYRKVAADGGAPNLRWHDDAPKTLDIEYGNTYDGEDLGDYDGSRWTADLDEEA